MAFQFERLCVDQTFSFVNCRSGGSQIFKQSQQHLRHLPSLSGAFRPPQGAWQQEGSKGQQQGLLKIQEWPCKIQEWPCC